MDRKLLASEVREKFLAFFASRGHRIVPSSSLVPRGDPTLLFTNAGMNQFKEVFTGIEKRDYTRAVSTQKCVRAGGKHNDLENVGRTNRHHTFFEMLGNFSFGDYFKKEAIKFAWEFVTGDLGLSPERLYVSVFQDDDESFDLWVREAGLSKDRIFRFGAKDNFWTMGDTGPCGPCSELFFDRGAEFGCGRPICAVGCDCDRYTEFWNLVFMEFEQQKDGRRTRLPRPSIDTGMGLERTAAIVQGVASNYDTDLFAPIFHHLGQMGRVTYQKANAAELISMRVVADHIRAMTCLIADGVRPSNEGRGYVLRRIMRRAMRHGRILGLDRPFLHELSSGVVKTLGNVFLELQREEPTIREVVRAEETKFSETIDRGIEILNQEIQKLLREKKTLMNGEVVFRLYETYGFPPDLTADVLRDHALSYDSHSFDEAFARHREKARGSWKGSISGELDSILRRWIQDGFRTDFLGYETLESEGTICHILRDGKEVSSVSEGEMFELVSDRTPFYGEAGGQVGDIGSITAEGFSIEVLDTKKPTHSIILHRCKMSEGNLRVGMTAFFSVDSQARAATAKNHTATHILHATLKEILGPHVKQEGSLVAPERLRFDFTHPSALTREQIQKIERVMNERIWSDTEVKKETLPLDKALATGAVALFDEKYGEQVRVLSVGDYSKELCGGTHLHRTAEIGLFKIVRESSVGAGIRRLEAFTSFRALTYVEELDHSLKSLASLLKVNPEELSTKTQKLLERQKELERELKKGGTGERKTEGRDSQLISEVNGMMLMTSRKDDVDPKELRELADRNLEELKSGVVAVGSWKGDKAFLVIKVSKDLAKRVNAHDVIQSAAKTLGGSGGGRAEMAQAGGPNVEGLGQAMDSIRTALESK